MKNNIKAKDALHLACAIEAHCHYLLTTDKYMIGGKMKSDALIRYEGMKLLLEHLGLVEAEKFISLIRREKFNYTEWQRNLWKDKNVNEIFDAAKDFTEKKSHKK